MAQQTSRSKNEPSIGEIYCYFCGARISSASKFCPSCGKEQPTYNNAEQKNGKSRVTAGSLAVIFGIIGAHKFYMGKKGQGIVYLLLCWTLIPCILGVIEGVWYLTESDESFSRRLGSGKVVEKRGNGVVGTVGQDG